MILVAIKLVKTKTVTAIEMTMKAITRGLLPVTGNRAEVVAPNTAGTVAPRTEGVEVTAPSTWPAFPAEETEPEVDEYAIVVL